jgi:hypothetical protein
VVQGAEGAPGGAPQRAGNNVSGGAWACGTAAFRGCSIDINGGTGVHKSRPNFKLAGLPPSQPGRGPSSDGPNPRTNWTSCGGTAPTELYLPEYQGVLKATADPGLDDNVMLRPPHPNFGSWWGAGIWPPAIRLLLPLRPPTKAAAPAPAGAQAESL